jgi:D-tyrosyl-tRNA(Tyr) deacylase
MRSIIQRVTHASVEVKEETIGKINHGFVVFIGISTEDVEQDAEYLAYKVANMRVFEDENGKMNKSLLEINGEVLAISQFTLYANTRKGRRPSFIEAARPEKANPLYNHFINILKKKNIKVESGIFGEMMNVRIHNNGPVTIMIDSIDRFKARR